MEAKARRGRRFFPRPGRVNKYITQAPQDGRHAALGSTIRGDRDYTALERRMKTGGGYILAPAVNSVAVLEGASMASTEALSNDGLNTDACMVPCSARYVPGSSRSRLEHPSPLQYRGTFQACPRLVPGACRRSKVVIWVADPCLQNSCMYLEGLCMANAMGWRKGYWTGSSDTWILHAQQACDWIMVPVTATWGTQSFVVAVSPMPSWN